MLGKQVLNQLGLLEQGRALKIRLLYRPENPAKKQTPYLTYKEQMEAGVCMTSFSCMPGGFADLCITRPLSAQELSQLRGELLELTDPINGQKLVSAIYGTEVFGEGPYRPGEEHLLLLPAEGYTFTPVLGRPWLWERAKYQLGTHQKDGVLYACGPGIKAGVKGAPAEIYDIVPTVLRVMGLPQPDNLDGRVIEELFEPARTPLAEDEEMQTLINRKLGKLRR